MQAEGGQAEVGNVLRVPLEQAVGAQAVVGNVLGVLWVQAKVGRLKLAMCSTSSGCRQKWARLNVAM